ncbi:hypothetical protein TOPH_08489, partial [Tolypocladium ophioglossoides CBS 100239]
GRVDAARGAPAPQPAVFGSNFGRATADDASYPAQNPSLWLTPTNPMVVAPNFYKRGLPSHRSNRFEHRDAPHRLFKGTLIDSGAPTSPPAILSLRPRD